MNFEYELNNVNDLKNCILRIKEAYLIRVKCICCKETDYFPFKENNVKFTETELIINDKSYPLDLIEYVSVKSFSRGFYAETDTYKISTVNFLNFLNEETRRRIKLLNQN